MRDTCRYELVSSSFAHPTNLNEGEFYSVVGKTASQRHCENLCFINYWFGLSKIRCSGFARDSTTGNWKCFLYSSASIDPNTSGNLELYQFKCSSGGKLSSKPFSYSISPNCDSRLCNLDLPIPICLTKKSVSLTKLSRDKKESISAFRMLAATYLSSFVHRNNNNNNNSCPHIDNNSYNFIWCNSYYNNECHNSNTIQWWSFH